MQLLRHASADKKPCVMHKYHFPKPIRTNGHHRYPMYLQDELWGEVRLKDIIYLCGTCHDSIHAWADWLLGRAYQPPAPGRKIKTEAQMIVDWYKSNKVVA